MIVETLIMGASLVGCMGCWAAVQKHRLTTELQKHKFDCEVLKPPPEPVAPVLPPAPPSPAQQSLTALLERREKLENHITALRTRVSDYSEARFTQYRADALKAIEDAREEQQELVLEQTGLLEMMQGTEDDAAKKPVRVDTRGPVAERVDDSGDVHAVELHDEETSRESAA